MRKLHTAAIICISTFLLSLSLLVCNNYASAEGGCCDIKDIYVKLIYGENVWEYRYPQIEYCGNFDKEIENSYQKDYRGRFYKRKKDIKGSYRLIDAAQKLEEIALHINTPPQNASVMFFPDGAQKFKIIEDVKGKKIDTGALLKQIEQNLSMGKSAEIQIKPQSVDAEITAASIKRATYIRREFSTDFSFSPSQRKHNIVLSLKSFNGMIIPPGQEISFNNTVGPRTEARGYKKSKIISGGDFIEGYGGGVCQTSTTLYNALILSDIKVTEYHSHSLAVSYISPSFDAMVNGSRADLKFVNNTSNFIFIKTWTENDRAYVRIYGEKLNYTIKKRSTITKTYPTPPEKVMLDIKGEYKDLYEGERRVIEYSKPKIESKGELIYYGGDNKIIKTILLRNDVYSQRIGKIVLGTQKRAQSGQK